MKKDRTSGIRVILKDLRPQRDLMRGLLQIGVPVALQEGFIQISFMVITMIANQRGLNDAAAVGIVEKLIGIMFLIPSSMLSSMSVLASQNVGAGKEERARQTLRSAIYIAAAWGIAAGLLMIPFLHNVVSIICVRLPVSYLASRYFTDTLFPMGLASPAGSLLSVFICIGVFYRVNRGAF